MAQNSRQARRVGSSAQRLVLVGGIVAIVFGAVAVVRGELSSPLTQPVVHVFGFDKTPLLGLIEIGAGVLLVLSALAGTRSTSTLPCVLLLLGGVLVLAERNWITTNLTDQPEFGWVPVSVDGVGLLALMVAPEFRARRRMLH